MCKCLTRVSVIVAMCLSAQSSSGSGSPDTHDVRHRDGLSGPQRCCLITITNPRVGKRIANPEALFVPFKGSFEGATDDASVAGAWCPQRPGVYRRSL